MALACSVTISPPSLTASADAPDLIAVPVRLDAAQQDWPELGHLLPAGSAAVMAAAGMTGKAGEVAEAAVRLGAGSSRVLFLGTGDGSPRALRRAGAELGRRAARGKTVAASAIAGLPDDGCAGFRDGNPARRLRLRAEIRAGQEPERRGQAAD